VRARTYNLMSATESASVNLRIVFMGTAEIASPVLRALAGNGWIDVSLVVSQPDRPKGRKLKLHPTPVKQTATALGLKVTQPERCRDETFLAALKSEKPDVIVVMAYGQLLPADLLAIPRLGCVNLHTSELPNYRGAAPIQWAIFNGDPETAVTFMLIDEGMDSGPILSIAKTAIGPTDDAEIIHDRLAEIGARELPGILRRLASGGLEAVPQDHSRATHARKITKEDGRLDWSRTARELDCQVRAFTPWPGSYVDWIQVDSRQRLKVWRAEPADAPSVSHGQVTRADREGIIVKCAEGALRILELQKEGGRRVSARDFLSGSPLQPGARFE
jgi:methionyl-tRNA formyltransferase